MLCATALLPLSACRFDSSQEQPPRLRPLLETLSVSYACLAVLSPTERAQAEAELLTALRQRTVNARAILGLSYLRSEEALPLLHHCLRQDFYAQYTLAAIARINPAGLDRALLANVLAPSTSASHFADVLVALPDAFSLLQVGTGVAVARCVISPILTDYLVRRHAINAWRRLYRVPAPEPRHSPAAIQADELFELICRKRAPRAYRQAQRLFIDQLPQLVLKEFPLTASNY